ncbi:MAG: hypothetical protein Q4C15_07580 [Eubacteriales bacterium]|nr:hypothetical protein [Eubacteriales bacterium]
MKRKAIAAILLSAVLLSACSSKPDATTPTTLAETETPATTAAETTEATTEDTEATEATEASEKAAAPVRLDKNVDDVIQVILNATGDEYFVFADDADMWQATIKNSEGIVDYKTCGYISRLEGDDMIDGYNTIYIVFEVYELDMDSEQYKHVCENGELTISRGEDSFTKKHAFVNGQFVLIACGALCNDDEFHYGTDPQELEPPYTIGKVQEGYDAFIALK